jgi:hypothetical protein
MREELEKVEMEEEGLYPFKFNDKIYNEKDCDEVFIAFYHDKESLNCTGGFVYVGDDVWVNPDGEFGSL